MTGVERAEQIRGRYPAAGELDHQIVDGSYLG
jgi:hypothetical protein